MGPESPTSRPVARPRVGTQALMPWGWGEALTVLLLVGASVGLGAAVMQSRLAELLPSVGKVGVRTLLLIAFYSLQFTVLAYFVHRRQSSFAVLYRLPLSRPAATTVRSLSPVHSTELSAGARATAWLGSVLLVLTLTVLLRIGGILWTVATDAIGWLPPQSNQLYDLFGRSPVGVALAIIAVVVVGPLVEELTFRVVIQGYLTRHLPTWGAVTLTAMAFAASHLSFWAFVPNVALGLATGYLAHRRATIWPAVALHAIYNASLVAAAYYSVLT